MPTVAWDENAPADTDNASAGDDAIRSLKTNISGGLGTSMYWPGTGGGSAASAGIMKPGSGRVFYATESKVSAAQDGQLMYASDTSRLWYVGTTGPLYLGGQYGIESSANPGEGSRWQLCSGVGGNAALISYGVTYGAAPRIVHSVYTSAAVGLMSSITGVTTTGFYAAAYNKLGVVQAAGAASVYWWSLGTVDI